MPTPLPPFDLDLLRSFVAIADADPYTKAGLFASVEVKPFNWVFNKPEA